MTDIRCRKDKLVKSTDPVHNDERRQKAWRHRSDAPKYVTVNRNIYVCV